MDTDTHAPVSEPFSATREPGGPPADAETILLVEDDEELRALGREVLEAAGYAVLEARDGEEGAHVADWHDGPIHLVVTDVVMPHANGGELGRRVRPLRPEAQVLYVSAYTEDPAVRQDVLEAGMPFLAKPFTPETLVRKVREILHPRKPSANEPT